jgi:GST-like protein
MAEDYTPPKVWTWEQPSGGTFASINRPIAGPTHDKELPVGQHPLQLYSLATPERDQGHDPAGGTAGGRS